MWASGLVTSWKASGNADFCDTRQQARLCQASGITDIVVAKEMLALWVCKRNANCVVINWNFDDMVGKRNADIAVVKSEW